MKMNSVRTPGAHLCRPLDLNVQQYVDPRIQLFLDQLHGGPVVVVHILGVLQQLIVAIIRSNSSRETKL